MTTHHRDEIQGELDALRRRLQELEGTVGSLNRRAFSRGLATGLVPLVLLVALTGVLYGQSAADALFIDSTGNVGIGTVKPAAKLHVEAGGVGNGIVIAGQDARIKLGVGQKTVWSWANGWEVPGDLSLIEEGISGTRLYVKPGGNVGVGTNNPRAPLDIMRGNRVGSHPEAVKGLYITADLGFDSDGIEFRHSNGSQGIGFAYSTVYATGANADQDLRLKARGNGRVTALGTLQTDRIRVGDQEIGASEVAVLKRLAAGELTIDLYNTAQREFLYAADCCAYDNDRRRVFTWRPKSRISQGAWKLSYPR
jgi:hypothetical protein